MIVLVAGGTGFLGSRVVKRLEDAGHKVVVHNRSFHAVPTYADTIVNCVGIIRGTKTQFQEAHVEKTRWLLKLGKKLHVRQFVQVSAIGADLDGTTYQRSKRQGELLVERSGLPYAIVRPSMIYGSGDLSVNTFKKIARTGFFPLFSEAKIQPVHVNTVADLIVAALDRRVKNRVVEVGGPEIFPYRSFADRIHPGVTAFRMPWPIVSIMTRLSWIIPIFPSKDMVRMMSQDNMTTDRTVYRLKIKNPKLR